MMPVTDDTTWHAVGYILKYESEALNILRELNVPSESESGMQGMPFRTDGGAEYTSMMDAEYLKSDGF